MLSNKAGGIITKGLGLPACQGMIVNQFRISILSITVNHGSGSGGGGYPGSAWNKIPNIQNFYAPDTTIEQPLHVPLDQEAEFFKQYVTVTITVTLKNKSIEKIYRVPKNKQKAILTITNILNITRTQIKIGIDNIKKLNTTAKITINKIYARIIKKD